MWSTIIPAAISAVGSFIGGERRNEQQTEMSREQMAFQERMSSTAHQREVADLRAAGLNPILSSKYGGSSTPSGAMPNITDSLGDAVRSGVSTAMSAQQLSANIENTQASTQKLRADTALSESSTKEVEARTYKTNQEGQVLFQQNPNVIKLSNLEVQQREQALRNLAIDEIAKRYGLSTARATEALSSIDDDFYRSVIGKALRLGELTTDAINPLVNSADAVSRMKTRDADSNWYRGGTNKGD